MTSILQNYSMSELERTSEMVTQVLPLTAHLRRWNIQMEKCSIDSFKVTELTNGCYWQFKGCISQNELEIVILNDMFGLHMSFQSFLLVISGPVNEMLISGHTYDQKRDAFLPFTNTWGCFQVSSF